MGDTLVGDQRHLKPATRGDSVQRRHHRVLGQQDLSIDVADRTEPILDLMDLNGARLLKVDTGAEGTVARASQDDPLYRTITVQRDQAVRDGTGQLDA